MILSDISKLKINTDINIIGGLPDFGLIIFLFDEKYGITEPSKNLHSYSTIKTTKSVNRFRKAISNCFLEFKNLEIEQLFKSFIQEEKLSNDCLTVLFWNLSFNNDLIQYLNDNVYFISLLSGRAMMKTEDVLACLKELSETDEDLKKWGKSTIETTASKYLTLLKKFNLLEGSIKKSIKHPYLSDKMFVLFVYWLVSVEDKSNILNSTWLNYSFMEKKTFVDRLLQKKFSKFYNVTYTGDNLKVEPIITYDNIYDVIAKS
jgi:hypothetical protein